MITGEGGAISAALLVGLVISEVHTNAQLDGGELLHADALGKVRGEDLDVAIRAPGERRECPLRKIAVGPRSLTNVAGTVETIHAGNRGSD